jgi:predicted DsbA family dithiol-disulfide isomerase
MDLDAMFKMLNNSGGPYGIEFGKFTMLSNSNMAIQASEYARDMGKYHEFHELIFKAYFKDCKDIGSLETIDEVASKCELNIEELHERLEQKYYKQRLKDVNKMAETYEITSIPTFIINDEHKIVGALSVDEFKRILNNIK